FPPFWYSQLRSGSRAYALVIRDHVYTPFPALTPRVQISMHTQPHMPGLMTARNSNFLLPPPPGILTGCSRTKSPSKIPTIVSQQIHRRGLHASQHTSRSNRLDIRAQALRSQRTRQAEQIRAKAGNMRSGIRSARDDSLNKWKHSRQLFQI